MDPNNIASQNSFQCIPATQTFGKNMDRKNYQNYTKRVLQASLLPPGQRPELPNGYFK